MHKQTNGGEFGYFGLISKIIPILTKSIILLEKYELFKYFNIKVMTQKLKVCFVDLKVMGMGNDNLRHFFISASILRMGPSYISLCKTSGPGVGPSFTPGL